jgi:RepB DNA-primase from phage plasmid
LNTSPDKWQAVWKVEGFDPEQAERLMRGLVREFGADPAATDASRVMRLPGLYNHKYEKPHLVRAEEISREVYRPEHFPQVGTEGIGSRMVPASERGARGDNAKPAGNNTQSEHDWAYARRALARGDDPEQVVRAVAQYRTDKPNPAYYAAHTVQKASASLTVSSGWRLEDDSADRSR